MGNVREIWMERGGEGSKGKPGKGGNEGLRRGRSVL